MSIEDRLRQHLHTRAEAIEAEAPAPAPERRRPRRLVPALAAATVVLVVVGGTAYLVGGDDPAVAPGDTATAAPSTAPPGDVPTRPAALDVSATNFAPGAAARTAPAWVAPLGDGYLAVVASADQPGSPTGVVRVWVSDDGVDWTEMTDPLPTGGASVWVSDVAAVGPAALVVIHEFRFTEGATPADTIPQPVVYATTDGRQWQRHEITGPAVSGLSRYEFVSIGVDGIAGGPAGAMIGGTSFAQVDVDRIAREEFGLQPGDYQGWMTDEERVEITLVDGSTVEKAFAELGITHMPGGRGDVGRFAWLTVDGSSWTRLDELPLPVPSNEQATAAVAGGFVAVGQGDLGPDMRFSADGRSWAQPDPAQFGEVQEFLAVAGDGRRAVVLARSNGTVAAWDSTDGLAWRRLPDLPAAATGGIMPRLAVGPLGVAATLTEYPEFEGEEFVEPATVVEKDGLVLRFDYAAGRVTLVDDVTGEVLVDEAVDFDGEDPPAFISVSAGTGEVTVSHPGTGEPLLTFGPEDTLVAEMDEVTESGLVLAPGAGAATTWFLADGEWQLLELPSHSPPLSVAVGADEILVSLMTEGDPAAEIWRGVPVG